MRCDRGHELVFWVGTELPCWMCGRTGFPAAVPTAGAGHRFILLPNSREPYRRRL